MLDGWGSGVEEITHPRTIKIFLPEDSGDLEERVLAQIPAWEDLLEKPERVRSVSFDIERLSTLTALRNLASARMDFDHLSARNP